MKDMIDFLREIEEEMKKQYTNVFKQDTNAFKQDTNAFKQDTNAFKQDTNAFKQDTNAFKQDTNAFKQDTNVFKLHYKRNREIYNRLKNKSLSNEYYKELIKFNLADKNLIDTWNKLGYENLCCMRCIQPIDHKYNSVCKCRIPNKYKDESFECDNCKCNGCGSFT